VADKLDGDGFLVVVTNLQQDDVTSIESRKNDDENNNTGAYDMSKYCIERFHI
jgi:hypothetical protein